MVKILGGQQVYTVSEIDKLMTNVSGFTLVDALPPLAAAKTGHVYYKRTTDTYEDITGYSNENDSTDIVETEDATHTIPVTVQRPILRPYIAVVKNDVKVWYTTGGAGSADDHEGITDEAITEEWVAKFGSAAKKYKLIKANKAIVEV